MSAVTTEPTPAAPSTSAAAERPRFYLPALDGLRWIAFLMVFLHHIPTFPSSPRFQFGNLPQKLWYAFWGAGMYGVPVFFALSGFLITSLLIAEKSRHGDISIWNFYVRRSLRIWPLYYLVLAIVVGLRIWEAGSVDTSALFGFIFFYGNWIIAQQKAFSTVYWSLCVEEQFYLVWPWFARKMTPKALQVICVLLVIVSIVFRMVAASHSASWRLLWFSTPAHLDSLALGSLLAIHIRKLPRWQGSASKTWLGMAACLGVMTLVSFIGPLSDQQTMSVLGAAVQVIVPVVACVTIWMLATKRDEVKILESEPVVMLGKISFGLYLFHETIIRYLLPPLEKAFRHVPMGNLLFRVLSIPIMLLITIGVAYVSYRFYETRFLALKKRFERVASRPA